MEESQDVDNLDSPYKNSLSDIKIVTENDDPSKDFRTPKPIKVQKKKSVVRQTKLRSSSFTKTKSTVKKNSIFKSTQDNFGLSDVNPDHLQMALALSKSTYAAEYPELSKDTEDALPDFLTPEKIPKGKTTLERYGFKSGKPKLEAELKRQPVELPKRNKNSKFRFITPTLKTRTVEERESIIATKISMILCSKNKPHEELRETQYVDELYSDMLKNFKGNYSLFAANGFGLSENGTYYKHSLNIQPATSKCGCLLKKWEDIPGRDKSPIRDKFNPDQTDKNNTDNTETISVCSSKSCVKSDSQTAETCSSNSMKDSQNLTVDYPKNRDCISPDLFESEDEYEYMQNSPDVDYSQCLWSPSKELRSLQADSFKNMPKNTSFKADNSIEFSDNTNTEETSQKNLPTITRTNVTKNLLDYSDEDTEVLYMNSLKEREEFIATVSREKTPKSSEVKPQRINEFVVDLTLSSEDDLSNHSTGMSDTPEIIDANLSEGGATKSTQDSDTNFEMSPLFLKDSGDLLENEKATNSSSAFAELPHLYEVEQSKHARSSFKISFGLDAIDDHNPLNVTDYVTQMLNQNEYGIEPSENLNDLRDENDLKSSSQDEDNDLASSQESCSKESIIISDEELNYSSVHSKNAGSISFRELSDFEGNNENEEGLIDIDEVYRLHSALRNKYKNMLYPIHDRVSELRGNSPIPKVSPSRASEDPFNDSQKNANILKESENNFLEEVIVSPISESKCTPKKKSDATSEENVTTPENNLIIKTSNVTPLVNYDEMDTPGIIKELRKYGLKPLKRHRGIKLLNYIYESTHPLVGSREVVSSDEDEQSGIAKKRKKTNNKNRCSVSSTELGRNLAYVQSGIEIIGDALLKSEDTDKLIFERKYSAKIQTCRIPLQIVWHNFLSQNLHIKENILLYEPLQLEVIHSMIKEQTGCKFHVQDLLTFFDKKCITFRTAQGSQRKNKF